MIKINKKFLSIFLISFIYVFFEDGYFPNAIFICIMIITLFSFAYVFITNKMIKVEIHKLKDSFITGEKIEINIFLENRSLIPINYIEIKYNEGTNWISENPSNIFNLKSKEIKNVKVYNTFYIRGNYNLTDININIKDIFNIFYLKKSLKDKINIKVYPKTMQSNDFYGTSNEKQNLTTNLLGDIENSIFIKDIRKYKIGDSLKRIHWKVSAKYGELYTKNYEMYSNEEYNIFLDMNNEIYKQENGDIIEEYTVEFLISFCKYLIDNNTSCVLNINNKKSMKFKLEKNKDITSIKEYFINNKSLGKEDFIYYMEKNLNKVNKITIIVMPFLTEYIWKRALEAIKLGYRFKIFYYKTEIEILYQRDMLKEMGIECISFKPIVDNL
ncbi:DUF58 domain-containing protein [Bacteroidales bacterium MSK.15.36]|nr:DUF58 domain-containing protein [Bacteroidales bacterium MSK.15.36]